jgi:hypothetical protein
MLPLHRLRPAATMLFLVVILVLIDGCGGATSTEVQYAGANGVSLVGTLVMPIHAAGQRVPGVIIIAGSGSADRDGNAPSVTTDLHEQIAELLAQDGIASLRYDKRGAGNSTPPHRPAIPQQPTPSELAALQDFVDWKNFVEDAGATASELLAQATVPEALPTAAGRNPVPQQQRWCPQPAGFVRRGFSGSLFGGDVTNRGPDRSLRQRHLWQTSRSSPQYCHKSAIVIPSDLQHSSRGQW